MDLEDIELSGLPFITLPENTLGRDFIIGDLHGCLDLLMEKMKEVDFDKKVDRLFCVGDLIDRGPRSMDCVELLYEPWFYATRGNHEQMFLCWISGGYSSYHHPFDFIRNGGDWVHEIDSQMIKEFDFQIREKMPFIINVGDENGFFIAHAFLDDINLTRSEDGFVWERHVFDHIPEPGYEVPSFKDLEPQSFIKFHELNSKLCYVGHNTVRHKMLISNNLLIDTGAYKKVVDLEPGFDLTFLEHRSTVQLLKEMPINGQTKIGAEEAV